MGRRRLFLWHLEQHLLTLAVALIGHSQGTTQTLIALSKDFVPDLGPKISVACLLAPAAYSGALLEKPRWFFRAMIAMPPPIWRICFGKHAFIQPMIRLMGLIPVRHLCTISYPVFHYMFKWSDRSWDPELRSRGFLFSPVYVSSEHMRWWLGANGFAKQRCVLNTRAEAEREAEDDKIIEQYQRAAMSMAHITELAQERYETAMDRVGQDAWFDERVPPLALWVAGCDELVDGKRLLRRFENGREPHARVVHAKVIEDYEHLDVIWGINVIEQVGNELVDIIWDTVGEDARSICRIPKPYAV
jgi:pimeloyl-ACP methyl ester carboxylesterase